MINIVYNNNMINIVYNNKMINIVYNNNIEKLKFYFILINIY